MTIRQLISPTETNVRIWLAMALVMFAVMGRLMPHPANFAPVAAVALFGGALLPRKLGLFLPLTIMVLSDLVIGLHPTIFFTWGSFLVIALAGSYFMKRVTVSSVVIASLGSSVFFYLVTNFGVWLEGRLYTQTFDGLLQCYINALPFFRNTLLGDLVFSAALFGAYVAVSAYVLPRIENRITQAVSRL